jgi:tartrate dehydratase beta subunit/fumarate hydratase class I family protein
MRSPEMKSPKMRREILLPAPSDLVRELRVGDQLYLSGTIFTARDEAHRLLLPSTTAAH